RGRDVKSLRPFPLHPGRRGRPEIHKNKSGSKERGAEAVWSGTGRAAGALARWPALELRCRDAADRGPVVEAADQVFQVREAKVRPFAPGLHQQLLDAVSVLPVRRVGITR